MFEELFFYKPIMAHLAQYLSIEDLFALSTLNRRMYHDWPTLTCVDVVDMRRLVHKRFGWDYKKANPFTYVRKYMRMHRHPFVQTKSTFRCTAGCGQNKRHLANVYFSKYAACQECIAKRYGERSYRGLLASKFIACDVFVINSFYEKLNNGKFFNVNEVWIKRRQKGRLLEWYDEFYVPLQEITLQFHRDYNDHVQKQLDRIDVLVKRINGSLIVSDTEVKVVYKGDNDDFIWLYLEPKSTDFLFQLQKTIVMLLHKTSKRQKKS